MHFPLPNGQTITHPALVAALVKPGDAILATLTPEKADAWHMASCIPGEVGELFAPISDYLDGEEVDHENLVEELGDIAFYVEGLRTVVGLSILEVTSPGRWDGDTRAFMQLPSRAADVFDAVKKWVIYNEPLDRLAIRSALLGLDGVLCAVRKEFGVSREEELAGNVMKLGARYANLSYSDQQAQDRADKAGTIH